MIPPKITQPVKTSDGRIGRILFYADYMHGSEPTSAVILFVIKWAEKYPLSALTPIGQDEYEDAIKAGKMEVQGISTNPVAVESGM